jgi:Na+/proline symporter
MTKSTRISGLWLTLAGLLGLAYFYLTDPRWGWLGRRSAGEDAIDLVHQLAPGTFVGLAGSAIVLLVGLWLATRRQL